MEIPEQFIQIWGTLGTNWGINRTMAQIHALLLIKPFALSTEEIMEQLQVSRGNVNMNVRELIAWGLVYRELKSGDRKEYFSAHKDMWEVAQCIIRERKKREFDPLRKAIQELNAVPLEEDTPETQNYQKVLNELDQLTQQLDKMLDKAGSMDKNGITKKLLQWFI
jgi:DNA-binding transcriptional regulator GbsR (MarR family)